MKLGQYHRVYFIGIGGIGMSALARWFHRAGMLVSGYDKTATALTSALSSEGIDIHYADELSYLPADMSPQDTLVVFTPAIPATHKQYNHLRDAGFTIMKRSEVLGLITAQYQTVAVAGTHGKTSTSALLAHILKSAGKDVVAFLGGVSTNYHSNLVVHGQVNSQTYVVAEADEFDRSFLRLHPQWAIVTSADADHLDIYGDHNELQKSFSDFIAQIRSNGNLIIHDTVAHLANGAPVENRDTYGLNQGQFFACNITVKDEFFEFDLQGPEVRIEKIKPGVPGLHNIENAVAAMRVALLLDIPADVIKNAMASFTGVKRRFEYIIKTNALTFIDDYAHHPAEITALIKSIRHFHPGKKITIVFQPHLFTRTRDFVEGFGQSLSLADEVWLLDIYPAREQPIPGITAQIIYDVISGPEKIICRKEEVAEKLDPAKLEVLATVGAGDIDTIVQPIKLKLAV